MTTAQIIIGQTIFSADTSTHGCREGWAAKVTSIDGDTVTAVVTSNTHCYGCWQTNCTDDDAKTENDQIGRVVTFSADWAIVDESGDVSARNWEFSA